MPPRRWLVDGNNLMGSRPDGWWRDRGRAMAHLAERLDAFARATGDEVTVVFDGPVRALAREVDVAAVEFAQATGASSADDVIAERVGADAEPQSLTVVTSDRGLAERVRRAGATVVGAGGFGRELDRVAPRRD